MGFDTVVTWKGQDIRTLSRDELIEALIAASGMIDEIREMQARQRGIIDQIVRSQKRAT